VLFLCFSFDIRAQNAEAASAKTQEKEPTPHEHRFFRSAGVTSLNRAAGLRHQFLLNEFKMALTKPPKNFGSLIV
jgi:hypothetical protein